ncbi:MAG: DNA-binding protein [Oscillospiraceae bacterium]|jgi:predicted DNA-binding protein YlxM (UPF0122 family)|nr:DNA-binding protein [Oscillospiraceae bacterium]
MTDNTLQKALLYDFYGELLTEKQHEYFDLYHNEDFSLAEIAEKANISRQGVYDIITRAEATLQDIENKTGIITKWLETRKELEQAMENDENIKKIVEEYFEI